MELGRRRRLPSGSWGIGRIVAVNTDGEGVAQVGVVADVGRIAAEGGDADHRVRRRAARALDALGERGLEGRRALGVDERHRALRQSVAGEERVVDLGQDVDERIADPGDVEGRLAHRAAAVRPCAGRAPCSCRG